MGLELNYMDGQTPISEEEKDELLIKTIATRRELDEFEQQNIEAAIEWTLKNIFAVEKILSIEFILEVHKRMFGNVWEWAGVIRKTNKNLGVDKYQVLPEVIKLLDDIRYWLGHQTYSHEEIAIRFKHRLVSIHPFPNGNGRHSRLCADILISHVFGKEVFTWGGHNLNDVGSSRRRYINAIYEADRGNIQPLVDFARSGIS